MVTVPTAQDVGLGRQQLRPVSASQDIRAPLAAFGGGRQLQEAGEALQRAGDAGFNAAIERQRMADVIDFNQKYTDGVRQIDALRAEYERRAEWRNMPGDFEQESGDIIQALGESVPPSVQSALGQKLTQYQTGRLREIQKLSVSRQKDWAEATLTQTLQDLQHSAATALPEVREQLMRQGMSSIEAALGAGMIDAEEAQKRSRMFQGGVDFIAAQRAVRADPDGFRSENYPGLSEQQAIRLEDFALRRIEQADREAERAWREAQDVRMFDLFNMAIGGDLSREQVEAEVRAGRIKPSQGQSLVRTVTNPPPVKTNPETLKDLYLLESSGDLSIERVNEEFARGNLSAGKRDSFIAGLTSGIESRPAYKRAAQQVKAAFKEDAYGITEMIDREAQSEALEDLRRRSLEGKENPQEVAEELLQQHRRDARVRRVQRMQQSLRSRLPDDYTRADVEKMQAELARKIRQGVINPQQAEQEARALEQLMEAADD